MLGGEGLTNYLVYLLFFDYLFGLVLIFYGMVDVKMNRKERMNQYDVWWEEVGGIHIFGCEAKSSQEARQIVNKMILIRKVKGRTNE